MTIRVDRQLEWERLRSQEQTNHNDVKGLIDFREYAPSLVDAAQKSGFGVPKPFRRNR